MRKIVILLASLAVLLSGCGGGSKASALPVKLTGDTADHGTKTISGNSIDVEINDFYFEPTFIKGGSAGEKITLHLTNAGQNIHTFTSDALGVDQTVQPNQTTDVQVTLPQSGATEFHCRFHQASNGMQGAFFFKDGDAVN